MAARDDQWRARDGGYLPAKRVREVHLPCNLKLPFDCTCPMTATTRTQTPQGRKVGKDRSGLPTQPFTGDGGTIRALVEAHKMPRTAQLSKTRKAPDQGAQWVLEAPVTSQAFHVPNDAHRVPNKRIGRSIPTPRRITQWVCLGSSSGCPTESHGEAGARSPKVHVTNAMLADVLEDTLQDRLT